MGIKQRLIVMNFLQFAVWGSYLVCIGNFLGRVGLGDYIAWFYVAQGVVSIFMPAVVGALADKFVEPQRMLGLSHLAAAGFMLLAAWFGYRATELTAAGLPTAIGPIFTAYCLSVAFYMPTIALSNTVAFSVLKSSGHDTVRDFPPIRVFGTVGFIAAMWFVNFAGFGLTGEQTVAEAGVETVRTVPLAAQFTYMQLVVCGVLGLVLGLYAFTLPRCPLARAEAGRKTLAQRLGLDAFVLFRQRKMALFFLFSMLLGVSLQITNGYATPYINSFAASSDSWFAANPTLLVSVSQVSEALCILLIPFFLRRFGIKRVMLMAMLAWVLRFAFFGMGTTESAGGVVLLFLSCVVYGVAFDFFNVSGALFVEQEASKPMQASAQGLFMLMTNGVGASVGTWIAGRVVSRYCAWEGGYLVAREGVEGGWPMTWMLFAAYALVVAAVFALVFRYRHDPAKLR
ncbi:MFS transporter [uncultured Alistipes sp.]|uniref:MFS transporter n=1 Tax=uncultured Alistipes sp. TaxID=538949 RepID=UPI00263A19FF|nr:MFS transporter [uncultured Alistipes sp.]